MEKIKKQLANIPSSPGVYKMIDSEGAVIYIGKAKNLSHRVKQYFQKDYSHSSRTRKMVEKVDTIDVTALDSELEAVILESTLIKQLKPKYNVIMKDDKNFVYIKITDEDYPRIQIVRKIEKDGAKYIGPKTASHKVKETLKLLKKLFPFRHCGLDIDFIKEGKEKYEVKVTRKVIKYPCLDYFIKRCQAPCIGKCTPEEYKKTIKNVVDFLEGRGQDTIKNLQDQMQIYAQNKEFEKAARLRDKIQKVKDILEKQNVSNVDQKNLDAVNYCIIQNYAYINLFQIREGKLVGQENFTLKAEDLEENDPEILNSFLKQYFEITADKPKEILLPHEIADQDELAEQLGVKIIIPKQGTKSKIMEMSFKNAMIYAEKSKPTWHTQSDQTKDATKRLQEILKLEKFPKRIECYDISHLSGTDTVGSMIVFTNGAPDKKMYRKFKIKTVDNKPDDFKSLEEVLTRRISRISANAKGKLYKIKKTKDKNSYTISKDKKLIAEITYTQASDRVVYLTPPTISTKKEIEIIENLLIKKNLEKIKEKRIYMLCDKKLVEKYLKMGFEEIVRPPEVIKSIKTNQVIVYDKNKHKEDDSFKQMPDLIIIDGGKGQLKQGTDVLKKFNLKIPHISLAKRLEEIFTPESKTPIVLENNDEALKLLQRARDEAHRFAITFNKDLRSRRIRPNA